MRLIIKAGQQSLTMLSVISTTTTPLVLRWLWTIVFGGWSTKTTTLGGAVGVVTWRGRGHDGYCRVAVRYPPRSVTKQNQADFAGLKAELAASFTTAIVVGAIIAVVIIGSICMQWQIWAPCSLPFIQPHLRRWTTAATTITRPFTSELLSYMAL